MNLEERYKAASADTYVGRVRTRQAEEAGPIRGVDFMDGVVKQGADRIQDGFIRNTAGDFKYGGGGKVAGTVGLSRWLAPGLEKGDAYFADTRFTTILTGNVRTAPGTLVHKYSPLAGKKFEESAILSSLAKGRITGAAGGPTP
jgi:hypothetical protein